MKELMPSRSNYDLADFSGLKGIYKIWASFLTSHFRIQKKLAKTSKTGLKLYQKLLPFPSPDRTGYRKTTWLDGLLAKFNEKSQFCYSNQSDGNSSVSQILMMQQWKVWQGCSKPGHCSNQCGGIFQCRAQLRFLLRWTEIASLFLIF